MQEKEAYKPFRLSGGGGGLKSKPTKHQTYKQKQSYKKWYQKHKAEKAADMRRRRALENNSSEHEFGDKVFHGEAKAPTKRPAIYSTGGRHHRQFRSTGLGGFSKGDIN